jgi:hypothetical protein
LWQVRSYNEQGYTLRLSHLEAPTPLDRADISGDLTIFSSINRPLRANKGTEERDESHDDLSRHCGKSAVTMNKVFIPLETPTPLDRGDIFSDLTVFFSINGPLREVKGTKEYGQSHADLA